MPRMRVPLVKYVHGFFLFLTCFTSLILTKSSLSQEGTGGLFHFFNGNDIDYWGEGKMVKAPLSLVDDSPKGGRIESETGSQKESQKDLLSEKNTGKQNLSVQNMSGLNGSSSSNDDHNQKEMPFSGSSLVRSSDSKRFSWHNYQDPKNPEFWDDGGDWIPPRPFREAAALPSNENIDAYLAWQMKKTEVTTRLQEAIGVRADVLLKRFENTRTKISRTEPRVSQIPWTSLQVAYFYQSTCPVCNESIPLVEELQKRGVKFHFIQLDFDTKAPLFANSLPYDREIQKQFNIKATPTWIFKVGQNSVMKQGRLSLKEIMKILEDLEPSLSLKPKTQVKN